MSEKYYVICHMVSSIDGRVAGKFFNNDHYKPYGEEYYRIVEDYNFNNVICGRVTYEESINATEAFNPTVYSGIKHPREDFISENIEEKFAIAIDPSGKLNWKNNRIGFGRKKGSNSVISVLSESVSDEYLAFLREKDISYIFAGTGKPLSMKTVLDKLNSYFGIKRFFVAGGGYVNGAFLSENLIDEISNVIAPVVEGNSSSVSFFEFGDSLIQETKEFYISSIEKVENDGVRIIYKK